MIPNPLKNETSHRVDDELQIKWSLPPNPKHRGDIDFTGDPGQTDQSHARDCDINNIMSTYHKTGVFPEAGEQMFADVSDAPSYQEARQLVIDAETAFMSLDAKTRKFFDNDAMHMLQFLDDPRNRDKAIELGMISAPEPTPLASSPELPGGQPGPLKAKAKTKSEGTDE